MLRRRPALALVVAVALLNVIAWGAYGLVVESLGSASALAGLGVVAYSLGVRHAFDADHIAAIDDSSRLLVGRGERPYSLGLFFALGHSSVVFLLCLGVGLAAGLMASPQLSWMKDAGSSVAAIAASVFLLIVGLMNLRACLRPGPATPTGMINSLLGDSFRKRLTATWQMFPVGFVFGLGLGTASEVALLGMSASAASNGAVPVLALLTLPLLFAAGMTLCDTADSIAMVNLYANPGGSASRRQRLNRVMTGLTAAIALFVGIVYLAAVLKSEFEITWLSGLAAVSEHFETLGYGIVAAYAAIWLIALATDRKQPKPLKPEPAPAGA